MAALFSVLFSAAAVAIKALPGDNIADQALFLGFVAKTFVPEALFLLLLLLATIWMIWRWPGVQNEIYRMFSDLSLSRRLWLTVVVTGVILCLAFSIVSSVILWARFTYVYVRDERLIGHFRRDVLHRALGEEAHGNYETAIDAYGRFGRMFPDRKEPNDIEGAIAALRKKMDAARFLDKQADALMASAGISRSVIELRGLALMNWPSHKRLRREYRESIDAWSSVVTAYANYRRSCDAATPIDPKQLSLALVALGYRHVSSFPVDQSVQPSVQFCRTIRQIALSENATFGLDEYNKFFEDTSEERLRERAIEFYSRSRAGPAADYYAKYQERLRHSVNSLFLPAFNTIEADRVSTTPWRDVWELGDAVEPAEMLDADKHDSSNKRSLFEVSVYSGANDELLLCWGEGTTLPSILLSGLKNAPDVSAVAACQLASRQFLPLRVRGAEMNQELMELTSGAVERLSIRPAHGDRPLNKSLCFMIAYYSRHNASPSKEARSICRLELAISRIADR